MGIRENSPNKKEPSWLKYATFVVSLAALCVAGLSFYYSNNSQNTALSIQKSNQENQQRNLPLAVKLSQHILVPANNGRSFDNLGTADGIEKFKVTFNIKKPQIVQGAIKNYFLGGSTGDTVQLSTSVFGNTNDNQIGTWELYGSTDARDISQTKAFSIFLIYLDYNNKITYDFIVGHFIVDPKTDDVKIATNTFDQFELVDDTLYSQYLKENSGVSGLLTYQQVENEIKYFKNAIFSNVN